MMPADITQPERPAAAGPLPPGFQRTVIIASTLFVALLATIDLTIVAVALPYMAGNLNATPDEITWVVTMFAVAQAITIGITGHLSRLLGRKVLVLTAIGGFVLSSVACGLSNDLDMIVAFRFVQGLFAGPLIPVSQAILIDAVEERERTRVLSFWVIGVMGGPAIGPLLGGFLAQTLDWRWNFWVNIPVGALALLLVWAFVRKTPHTRVRTDWIGLAFLALFMASLQIALNEGDTLDWFSSRTIVFLLLLSCVALIIVVARGLLLGPRHIIDLRLFGDFRFTACCLMLGVFGSSFLALLILSPQLFVDGLGWPSSSAGLVIGVYGLGGVVGSLLAGLFSRFASMRVTFFIACVLVSSGWYLFSRLDADTGMGQALLSGVLVEAGIMFIFPLLAARAFANLPPQAHDEGAGLLNLVKTLGFAFGTTAVGTFLYQGHLANWNRYVGNVSSGNPALERYLDALGADLTDGIKMTYVARVLEQQMRLLTITQLAEMLAVGFAALTVFVVFFGSARQTPEPRPINAGPASAARPHPAQP